MEAANSPNSKCAWRPTFAGSLESVSIVPVCADLAFVLGSVLRVLDTFETDTCQGVAVADLVVIDVSATITLLTPTRNKCGKSIGPQIKSGLHLLKDEWY